MGPALPVQRGAIALGGPVKATKSEAHALLCEASTRNRSGDYVGALKSARRALTQGRREGRTDTAGALLFMSHVACSLNRLSLARRYARLAIKEAPDEWVCLSGYANLERDAGGSTGGDDAKVCYQRAVEGYERALAIATRKRADAEDIETLRSNLGETREALKKARAQASPSRGGR